MRDIKLTYLFIFIFSAINVSCTSETERIDIAPYEVLHDNSSKVWILKSQFENDVDKTPINRLEKWTITFYNDRTFVLNNLENFAHYSVYQGGFSFNEDNSKLIYQWNSGQQDENNIVTLDRQNLVYSLETKSKLTMHFIPLDKNPAPPEIDNF